MTRFLSLMIYRGYHRSSSIRYSVSAFSSSAVPGKKQNENEKTKKDIPPHNITASGSNSNTILNSEQLDASTRAMGQVIFLNSTTSGRIIFASLVLGDPTLAAFAALGSFTATSTSKFIGLDEDTYKNGLWGYNGALIGCAASVFGPAYPPYMVLSTILGSAATPVLSASLKNATSLPQWTWPFNIVALTSLLQTRSLLESSQSATTDTGLEETVADSSVSTIPTTEIIDVVSSPLLGISQIFVVGSPLTGAGISAAIYMYSPKLAYHALGGSAVGCAVGVLSGADLSDVCMGLWGYNSALSSMAIGTFFVHSRESMILSASSAVASAALFGGMQSLFGTYGLPCLTLPFCSMASAITSVCYLSNSKILGLKLACSPHSPEKNS